MDVNIPWKAYRVKRKRYILNDRCDIATGDQNPPGQKKRRQFLAPRMSHWVSLGAVFLARRGAAVAGFTFLGALLTSGAFSGSVLDAVVFFEARRVRTGVVVGVAFSWVATCSVCAVSFGFLARVIFEGATFFEAVSLD